jgi:hypothetical protein
MLKPILHYKVATSRSRLVRGQIWIYNATLLAYDESHWLLLACRKVPARRIRKSREARRVDKGLAEGAIIADIQDCQFGVGVRMYIILLMQCMTSKGISVAKEFFVIFESECLGSAQALLRL